MERSSKLSPAEKLRYVTQKARRFGYGLALVPAMASMLQGCQPPPKSSGEIQAAYHHGESPNKPNDQPRVKAPPTAPAEAPLPPGSKEMPQETEFMRFTRSDDPKYPFKIYFKMQQFRDQVSTCAAPDEFPQDLAHAIYQIFGSGRLGAEAGLVAWSENGSFDRTSNPTNTDGSTDYGYMQINSGHLYDNAFKAATGVNSAEDLFDPIKNVKAAKYIRDDRQNWSAWYGPARVGCDRLLGFEEPSNGPAVASQWYTLYERQPAPRG